MSEQRKYRNNSPERRFPSNTDNINEFALKELYINLLSCYKELNQDNNLDLMRNYKKEKILIQELKNENELLKHSIEKKRIKFDLLNKNSNSENYYNLNEDDKTKDEKFLNDKDNYNSSICNKTEKEGDESKKNQKAEIIKLKKDLVLLQAISKNYKSELDNIKILNENYKTEMNLLNGNIEELKLQLDKVNLKRSELENENNIVILELEKIKKQNEEILDTNKSKSNDLINKFKELSYKYENNNEITLSRHAELNKLNEKLVMEIENLKSQIKAFDNDKNEILCELNFERENIVHMQKDIDDKKDLLIDLKKENFELNKKLKDCLESNKSIIKNCNCLHLTKLQKENEEKIIDLNKNIEELKKILSLEQKKFKEIVTNNNKLVEDHQKEKKILSEEKYKSNNEIDKLKRKLDKTEIDNFKLDEDKNIYESENLLLKENIENLNKELQLITNNRNSIQTDFNQLSNQYNSLKERFEKEMKNKTQVILELQKSIENLNKEVIKLKDNRNSIQFQNLNSEETVTTLQNKLNQMNFQENELKMKLKDYDKVIFEKNNLDKSIEESKKIINYLENQINDLKIKQENNNLDIAKLKNENLKILNNQMNVQKEQISKSEELNIKIIDDLKQEIKKINELNLNLSKEKEGLLNNSFNNKMELNSKQEIIEKIFKENKMLNDIILKTKSGLYNLFSELKMNLNKIIGIIFDQIKLLKKENIDELLIEITIGYINSISREFEDFYNKFLKRENLISNNNSLNQIDKLTLERNEIENDKLFKKNSELLYEIENLKDHIGKLNSDLYVVRKNDVFDLKIKNELQEQISILNKEKTELKKENVKIKNENEIFLTEKKKD